ncbi:MAG: radical SAM family heme chaperone HemW [Natronincolaceae bacterium]|jgi:oxygen-independent coproporphyrinogen-3 oxidase|nr:radical SAM family heme chaperone HemW [Bacillota bacterium]NLK90194.1 oxygen-independent coproporphyrinogen III oxidase [Clostridiales bacterium]
MGTIALYIHIPFCQKKCNYCDFNSYSGKQHLIRDYIEALKKEIRMNKNVLDSNKISTIFFGGGTPSILEGDQIVIIMDTITKYCDIEENAEVSIEANPGTLSHDKLAKYYDSGINRLSIGLQACQNDLLKTLGRIHSFEDYLENLKEAREIGFSNINTDLMFSLPGQSKEDLEECLERVVSLNIPHISAYSLIIEEGTLFGDWVDNKTIILPDEEIQLEMYHSTIRYLKEKNYIHYEISNFAKPGFQCRHNMTYWHNEPYLGLGAGSHSYLNKKRFNNVNDIEKYIYLVKNERTPVENEIDVSDKDEIGETMFLGLRLIEGISVKKFIERFNASPFEIYREQIEKFSAQGLLEYDKANIRLTQRGIDLSNVVFREMLLD